RTQAEYETLIFLLKPAVRRQWAGKIGLGTSKNLHNRHWSFVEQVTLSRSQIVFRFNPSSLTPGPFHARVEIRENSTGALYSWEDRSYVANASLDLNLSCLKHPERYMVSLRFDKCLAYANRYDEVNRPL